MSTLSPMQRVTFEKSVLLFFYQSLQPAHVSHAKRDLNSEYQILDRNSLDLSPPNALSISCL